MSDSVRVGIVIEPTVAVANGLLDVARRLASELGPRAGDLAWVPPSRYVAPLAVGPVDGTVSDDAPVEMLRIAAREIEEFGIQLAPPILTRDGPTAGRVVTKVTSKGEELASAIRIAAARLGEIVPDVQSPEPVCFPLAYVSGEAALEAVAAALPADRDAPLAGWLVGGLCLYAGPLGPDGRSWAATRVRSAPLRRLGSRRGGSSQGSP